MMKVLIAGKKLTSALAKNQPNQIRGELIRGETNCQLFVNPNTKLMGIAQIILLARIYSCSRDVATERKHLTCNYHHADGEYLLVISLGSDVSESDL